MYWGTVTVLKLWTGGIVTVYSSCVLGVNPPCIHYCCVMGCSGIVAVYCSYVLGVCVVTVYASSVSPE